MEVSKKSSGSEYSEIDISAFMDITKAADSDSETSDHFFEEDLVWPDPENVFKKVSGIKPSVLTAELKHLNVGGMDLGPKTRCQTALIVRKRPRPKSLPWNVVVIDSDPPLVDEDDVDEYLVHDPLFVEFFNAFLALPSFPEAVCFNIESGGFEVVTDHKQKLAQQIKEVIRSHKATTLTYSARQHAFSDIPVVPIEDTQGPEQNKIETTFDVMALNKEQGLLWVKSARLPLFLESDYYFQYRLAKVISQATIFNEDGEFVVMKIDYTTKSKTKKKTVEIQPPSQEELIIKQMFVSFGDMKGAAKEAWFTQAKEQLKTESTFTTLAPRVSSAADSMSIKPSKKSSVFQSHYFGVYSPGLTGPNDSEPPIHDLSKIDERNHIRERPFTPRPADRIHADTAMLRAKLSMDPNAEEEMVPAGHVVFMWPKQDLQQSSSESNFEDKEDREAKFAQRMKEHQIIDQIYSDGSWEEGGTGNIVLRSVDELGAVIVGAIMKKTVAEITGLGEDIVVHDPGVSGIYPSRDLTCVSVDKLHLCVVAEASASKEDFIVSTPASTEIANDAENIPDRQPVHVKWSKHILKSAEDDPDAESILDSDEDFEERDIHFRRNQNKWHSLTSLKGIHSFKKFLKGTEGDKYWELWIDIDKGRLIRNEEEKQKYIMLMRDKFYKKGSAFELSAENKRKLGLENLSEWIPEHLFRVQARVLEPLVLYWAPRYLFCHLINTRPEKYYLYNEMISSRRYPPSEPYPNTEELLPLRPKSCCPRSRLGPEVEEMSYNAYKTQIQDLRTAPRIGNRRVYGDDTIQRLLKTPTAKYLKHSSYADKIAGVKIVKPDQVQKPIPGSASITKYSLDGTNTAKTSLTVVKDDTNGLGYRSEARSLSKLENVGQSQQILTTTIQSELTVKEAVEQTQLPCPCKPLDAILGSAREQRNLTLGSLRKSQDLLLPIIKIQGTEGGGRYRDLKSTYVKKTDSQEAANYTFFRQDSRESRKSCQQHGDQVPTETTVHSPETEGCDFLGSKRMEFLLQALHHELDSGRTFRKFIENSQQEHWINNLDFWENVQEYRKLFYKDKLDLHIIIKQVKSIYSQFIVECSPQNIMLSKAMELYILDHLSPPYEDLFDRAEETALRILFEAFQLYLSQDVKSYCTVERVLLKRRLETRNFNILNLQKLGIIKERPLTPDNPMEGYVDPVYDDSVLARIPENLKNWNMDTLAQNKLELEYFRQFLIPRCAEIDLKVLH